MAITDKEQGVWGLDQVYNKINQGSIWEYSGITQFFTMGGNNYGASGLNGAADKSSPTQLSGTDWSKVVSSGYARGFLATRTDGTAWSWGRNSWGTLGVNDNVNRSSPIQIGTDTTWGSEFARCIGSYWIKTDGTLWAWGRNNYGSLGQNQGQNSYSNSYSSPVQIPGTTWSKVAAAQTNSWAIKTDGTLWGIGRNTHGSLGQNNVTDYSSPVQIPGTTWSEVGCTSQQGQGLGIKTDGTLWSWGPNSNGSLGQNNAIAYSSPVQIPGTTWSKISGGNANVGAIKTDGTLWSWGYGGQGRLGDNNGSAHSLSSPIQIPGTTWSGVTSGASSMHGVKTDGTLWGWGPNGDGELGQNNTTKYSSPVQVGSDSGWSEPAASAYDIYIKKLL